MVHRALLTHRDLADQRTNIDQKVVTHVYSGVCNARVHYHSFTVGLGTNKSSRMTGFILLRDKRRDAAFEKAPASG